LFDKRAHEWSMAQELSENPVLTLGIAIAGKMAIDW
jgi:hypothetical protein